MEAEKIVSHIVDWLKAYSSKSKTNGFIVGVSGGIDSAVTSALCARTGLPVLCVEMPIHQSPDQVSRASRHIDQLIAEFPNVKRQELNLTPIFDAFVEALPKHENVALHEFSLVNTRARFRMSTLYYFAALHKSLVAGTGNKIEDFGIGFFTKYGDGGVDLSPIADLTKTEVYAIGKELGISNDIMTAPPTDGLWGDSRTDEDQIGASYPELEWAMDFKGDESDLSERQTTVLALYRKLNEQNKHKVLPIPVCIIPEGLK
jgi:NAD+ synthase